MEGIPVTDWTITSAQEYTLASLWAVHYGIGYYFKKNAALPAHVSDLAGSEYIPEWPANPFNNWDAVEVLSTADGFAPGNLALQICPRSITVSFAIHVRRPMN